MVTRGESTERHLELQFEDDWDCFERDTLRKLIVSPAKRMLSFGCGPGFDMRGMLRDGLALSAAGCDQGDKQLEFARRTFQGSPCPFLFTWNGQQPAPAEAGTFDLIYVRLVLQHLNSETEILQALRHLAACLEPGGRIVVHDVDRTRPDEIIERDLDQRVRALDDTVASFQRDALGRHPDAGARLSTWLRAAGLEVAHDIDTLSLGVAEENRVVLDLREFVTQEKDLARLPVVAGTTHEGRLVQDVFAELESTLDDCLAREPQVVHLRTKKSRRLVAARRS